MDQYRVLVTIDFFQIERPSSRDRKKILFFLDSIVADPFRPGDYEESDKVGRPVQIKIVGKYALTYWVDHSEKEIKVIKIESADH